MATARREADAIPLSRFGVLVAQLDSIAAAAVQRPPDAVLSFDILSQLVDTLDDEPKESIQQWQRKCEDALYSLLIFGARCPVRRLASVAMGRVIEKGDTISIYSRVSSLQGWLADVKKSEPLSCAGVARCLGELYRLFGRKITSGLIETASIAGKLMKFYEDFVRKDALLMLENALEGCGGSGSSAAYAEAYRIIMRVGVSDKSFTVRMAAARCLKAFANIGGPGLGIAELESSISYCLKALDDPISSVRDAFAEALGGLLALAMNPEAQIKPPGNRVTAPARKLEDGVQKHLISPFVRACGIRAKDLRIGLTLSWVFFLQVLHGKYHIPDNELQDFALIVMEMLKGNDIADPHALACVLYIIRVGIADQLTESSQCSFLVFMGKQIESVGCSPSTSITALRILSYLLTNVGMVPAEFKDILDNTVVAALSDSSLHVRIEAALTLRALAKVDPTCVGGLISYGMTTLHALRESGSFEKGRNLNLELNSLHGQAALLAALVSISPKLLLGYPSRLPHSVYEVSKKMLTTFSRNPQAATMEKESGWMLLASLVATMPKEELEDQAFDVLLLWADPFAGNPETYFRQTKDLAAELRVLSAALEALTAFIRSFVSPTAATYNGLLQPVLACLSGALFFISYFSSKQLPNVKSSLNLFTIRTLMAYQSITNPMEYENDHKLIIQICTSPFSDPSGYEESSSLRTLLDKKDACLGPWIPGSDWYEDELRAFDGGKDGLVPCVWDDNIFIFPQPESLNKMLVNQMLLSFGTMFAIQDNGEKIILLNKIDQCLRSGKKQPWHVASVTNACVGLLAGLKAMLSLRQQTLTPEVLSTIKSIFMGILAEGEICSAQRRASCESLGLLARIGSDVFTAKMIRSMLGELVGITDPYYIASICLSLGCIYRSAGGIALTSLVTSAVKSISSLAKSSNASLQLWSLHSLLLIIEAAGLSYVHQVQATLFLAMEILLAEENCLVDFRQEIGRLINAVVAVLGPELVPRSTFFSRCKSVISEISSFQETSTLLESVRFTQQLALFAPQAASVHTHVRNLLPTLCSRQPSLRHLAVSTLRHLIEKDPKAMFETNIEENLFYLLDEETDSEIVSLVCSTITQWLQTSCTSSPSRWLNILYNKVLATSTRRIASQNYADSSNSEVYGASEGGTTSYYGEDDEDMISSSKRAPTHESFNTFSSVYKRGNHLRYRTRLFAAECLSSLPTAVGANPAHFDLSLARNTRTDGHSLENDWLVLHLQELISISYQLSTSQFEGMQPIGVRILCTIMDKFGAASDPDLPGQLLMEQYQAQLVSAVRSSISTSSGPLLLEAGLELATKILTSRIISGDRVALNRMYALISRPLDEIKDLCYPSFSEWIACKIKIRLLAAHASIKHCVYQILKEKKNIPDEYLQLVPQLSSSSAVLGKYWIGVLKDFAYICFGLHSKFCYRPFLDGIQFAVVSVKVKKCIEEVWPLILQATVLDSVPVNFKTDNTSKFNAKGSSNTLSLSGHSMVGLEVSEFHFLWGLSQLIMFQGQQVLLDKRVKMLLAPNEMASGVSVLQGTHFLMAPCEVALTVFQSISNEAFFSCGFLSSELCIELLQILMYSHIAYSRSGLVVSLLSQIVQVCPDAFFELEDFTRAATELYLKFLIAAFQSKEAKYLSSDQDLIADLSIVVKTITRRTEQKLRLKLILSIMSLSHQWFIDASTDLALSKIAYFLQSIAPSLKDLLRCDAESNNDDNSLVKMILGTWASMLVTLSGDCIKRLSSMEKSMNESCRLLAKILVFCLEETISLARLVHEAQHLAKNSANEYMLFISIFNSCTNSVSNAILTSNAEVKALGMHVLKTITQRELAEASHGENHSFLLIFMGQLLRNLFLWIQQTVKEHVRRESLAIIEDYLKLLFLVHTLGQGSECQHHITVLLLEALYLVFSQSSGHHSEELIEVNATARRMVSHLVQIPTAATQLKDVMVAMPVSQRQQIQDMIRASLTQDQVPMQPDISIKDETKMPNPNFRQEQVGKHEVNEGQNDECEDEDDDWDIFQSFNADTTSGSASDLHDGRTRFEPASFDNSSTVNIHRLNQNDAPGPDPSTPKESEETYDALSASAGKDNEVNDALNESPSAAKELSNLGIEELEEESNIQPSDEGAVEVRNGRSVQEPHREEDSVTTTTLHKSLQSAIEPQEEKVIKEQTEPVHVEDATTYEDIEVHSEKHHGDVPSAPVDTGKDNEDQHPSHEVEVQSATSDAPANAGEDNDDQHPSHEVEVPSATSDDADNSKKHSDDAPIAQGDNPQDEVEGRNSTQEGISEFKSNSEGESLKEACATDTLQPSEHAESGGSLHEDEADTKVNI